MVPEDREPTREAPGDEGSAAATPDEAAAKPPAEAPAEAASEAAPAEATPAEPVAETPSEPSSDTPSEPAVAVCSVRPRACRMTFGHSLRQTVRPPVPGWLT